MTLDTGLWLCGAVEEAALTLLLLRTRVFRHFPAFVLFICWSWFSDTLLFAIQSLPADTFFHLYEVQLVIDSTMIFGVLVELSWSVLRPIRKSLPRGSWMGIALLIALAGLVVWPVAGLTLPHLAPAGRNLFRLQQTFAILRIVVFLVMAGFSQILSIGWRDRELQVATGLGFYSIVSLAVSVLHTYQVVGPYSHWAPLYHRMDEVVMVSYVGVLAYWVASFAGKEAARMDFSPQMEQLLLTVARGARTARSRMATTSAPGEPNSPEQ